MPNGGRAISGRHLGTADRAERCTFEFCVNLVRPGYYAEFDRNKSSVESSKGDNTILSMRKIAKHVMCKARPKSSPLLLGLLTRLIRMSRRQQDPQAGNTSGVDFAGSTKCVREEPKIGLSWNQSKLRGWQAVSSIVRFASCGWWSQFEISLLSAPHHHHHQPSSR